MEDRSRRDGEFLAAGRAFPPDRRLCQGVDRGATAVRAERRATVVGEPDPLEGGERLLIGQPENLSDAQAPCGWGEKEARHCQSTNIVDVEYKRWCMRGQRYSLTPTKSFCTSLCMSPEQCRAARGW